MIQIPNYILYPVAGSAIGHFDFQYGRRTPLSPYRPT